MSRLVPFAAIGLAAAVLLPGCGDDVAPEAPLPSVVAESTTAAPPSSAPPSSAPPSSAPTTTAEAAPPQPLPGGTLEVLVVGDSVMFDASAAIQAALTATGAADVRPRSSFGLGFSDRAAIPFAGAADELLAGGPVEQIIVMIGSWDHLAAQRDPVAYAAMVDDALTTLSAGGHPVLVLGEPPSAPAMGEEPARTTLNGVLEAEAAAIDGVSYLPTDAVIGDAHGAYVRRDETGTLLRKPDGRHLCPEGAERFGRAVLTVLRADWALPAPDASWVVGDWRTDPRYDNPPGGCTS